MNDNRKANRGAWLRRLSLAVAVLAWILGSAAPLLAKDRHAGYYYPRASSSEEFKPRVVTMSEANRRSRIQFVVGWTQQMLSRPYAPEFAIFAKGDEAEKLIIVALQEGSLGTIYRARAALAMMTSIARTSEFLNRLGVQDYFTFFDLATLFGFTQITITDGDRYSHQIVFK
ncbi:MAG: molybdopterin-guanine dinucleotide biosynthesis protein A [Alphaproteobacteria bacterium]